MAKDPLNVWATAGIATRGASGWDKEGQAPKRTIVEEPTVWKLHDSPTVLHLDRRTTLRLQLRLDALRTEALAREARAGRSRVKAGYRMQAVAADRLRTKLLQAWAYAGPRGGSTLHRDRVTLKLTAEETATARNTGLTLGVKSPRYTARYRTKIKEVSTPATATAGPKFRTRIEEVEVRTNDRWPSLKRRFKVAGHRAPVFVLISIRRAEHRDTNAPGGSTEMGKRKSNKESTKTKAAEVEEEVVITDDDIEELEQVEASAPESESDDDANGGLSDLNKTQLKAKAKEAGLKGFSKLSKEELVEALEKEAGDDEDDGDDTPDLDSMSRKKLKAFSKEHDLGVKAKKYEDVDDLRAAITAALKKQAGVEEEKPAKKGKGKKGGGKKGQAPPTRELPKGKLGAAEVGKLAGVDARVVRLYLRKHKDKWPKDEELGRYAFNKSDAAKLAKAVKKDAAAKDEE